MYNYYITARNVCVCMYVYKSLSVSLWNRHTV